MNSLVEGVDERRASLLLNVRLLDYECGRSDLASGGHCEAAIVLLGLLVEG